MYNHKKYFKNIINYSKINYPIYFSFTLIALLISYFSFKDYFRSFLTIIISTLFLWLGHYSLHNFSSSSLAGKMHKLTHHSYFSNTFWGKIIEFFVIEFFFCGTGLLLLIVLLIKKNYKIYILNPYIILYWTISFIVIHEFSHHNPDLNEIHKDHHQNPTTCFFPEFWDIIFKTKLNNKIITREFLIIPVLVLIACILILLIKSPFDLIDKYFS